MPNLYEVTDGRRPAPAEFVVQVDARGNPVDAVSMLRMAVAQRLRNEPSWVPRPASVRLKIVEVSPRAPVPPEVEVEQAPKVEVEVEPAPKPKVSRSESVGLMRDMVLATLEGHPEGLRRVDGLDLRVGESPHVMTALRQLIIEKKVRKTGTGAATRYFFVEPPAPPPPKPEWCPKGRHDWTPGTDARERNRAIRKSGAIECRACKREARRRERAERPDRRG